MGLLEAIDRVLGTRIGLLVNDPRAAVNALESDARAFNQASLLATQAERNANRGLPVTPEQAAAKRYIDQKNEELAMGFAGQVIPTRQAALDIASKNAEKMLGLPKGNTAMDRAEAMGFDVNQPVYHGTYSDISVFDPKYANTGRKTGVPEGTAAVVSSNPKIANSYAFDKTYLDFVPDYPEGANVIPLLINKGNNLSVSGKGMYWNEIQNKKYPDATTTNEIAQIAKNLGMDSATIKNVIDSARLKVSKAKADTTFMFEPSKIRSRFAAFDPARVNEPDLLAAGVPIGLIAGAQVDMPKPDKKKKVK